jgi:hypothetical protein
MIHTNHWSMLIQAKTKLSEQSFLVLKIKNQLQKSLHMILSWPEHRRNFYFLQHHNFQSIWFQEETILQGEIISHMLYK